MRKIKRFSIYYFPILFALFLISGKGSEITISLQKDTSAIRTDKRVRVWWSSELFPESTRWFTDPPNPEKITYKLAKRPDLFWKKFPESKKKVIRVKSEKKYQSILGLGTSLEGTTIYAICKDKTKAEIRMILKMLIDPLDGMGLNLFRITIGTSDFSDGRSVSVHPKGFYSYQDDQNAGFSIQPDIDLGIVDFLKLVQEVALDLPNAQKIRFFASCWSPPGWMKTSGNLIGGTLRPGYEKHLAKYFRNFIEAYESLGIPIYAITLQNEPNFVPDTYPGMKLSAKQQLDIVIATYEEFHYNLENKRELNTRIWINDHNFEDWIKADYILTSLEKMGKKHYVDATAFHNYSDTSASVMTKLHQKHPGVDIQFTEHSEWGVAGMYNIQQYFWNWSRSYMYWVAMTTKKLDEHNQGPYNQIGELSPTLLIEKYDELSKWFVTPEYYLISQFSKFIRPGAYRIDCDPGSVSEVTFVAFRNPDETIVLIGVNQTNLEQKFNIQFRDQLFFTNLPAKSVGTFQWSDNGSM